MRPLLYSTPQSGELITTLPITNGTDPYLIQTLFELTIPTIKVGDILSLKTYASFTNDTHKLFGQPGYNVMIAWYTSLEIPQLDGSIKELELSEKKGCNFNPERHHETITDVCDYQSRYDLRNAIIKFNVYSASTEAKLNEYLKVDKDYGRMSCLLFIG